MTQEGTSLLPSLSELSATADAPSLEAMSRPLLDWLQRMTGLESTYLTSIDWEGDEQEILYAVNRGALDIAEGLRVTWSDTLCRRALDGGSAATDDVPMVYPGSDAARAMGLQTYVSVPVQLPGGAVFGTLCGASSTRQLPSDEMLTVMRFFAQLVADRVTRERELTSERAHVEELRTYSERIAALERVKSDFLRLASHELRQPSTVMGGYLDLLLGGAYGELDTKVRETLAIVSGRLESMERLLDQMLDTARLEDDRMELLRTDVDMVALLRAVADGVRESLDERHRLEVTAPGHAVVVNGDPDRLHVILGNLLHNAVKYSPAGGTVWCSLSVDHRGVLVTVEDEGVGITADQAKELFGRFVRITDGAHAGIPGTGLGLHISRELARRHGGDLDVAPRRPRGTTFHLTLPVAAPA